MNKILISILILLLAFSIKTDAQIAQKPKADYPYLLYLPKDYPEGTKDYPLVIYLGGGAQNGNDLNKLKTYGVPYYVEQGQEYDFIIASPQCPERNTGQRRIGLIPYTWI